jgi:hypothetical protein
MIDRLTTATPVEIDRALAALWQDRYAEQARASQAWDTMTHYVREVMRHQGTIKGFAKPTPTQVRDFLSEHAEISENEALQVEAYGSAWIVRDAQKAWEYYDRYQDHSAKADEALMDMEPLDQEFARRGGWNRAYLVVTNGSGHVHRSMNCSTCYPTTQYHWMTDYSDHTEAEIVEAAGERACTVCYPSAPVGVKGTRMFTPDEVEKQKRAQEREQKRQERAAATITLQVWEKGFRQAEPSLTNVTWKTTRALQNDAGAFVRVMHGGYALVNGFRLDLLDWVGDQRVPVHQEEAKHNLGVMLEALQERGVDTEALVEKNRKRAEKER